MLYEVITDATVAAAALHHPPEGEGVAAQLMVDHMARLGRRVVAQGQLDASAPGFRFAPAERGVGLFGFPVMELAGQLAVA